MDDATTAHDATSALVGTGDSVAISGGSPDAMGTSALTPLCGPHCGLKDKHVGHCDVCHMIQANFVKIRENHLRGGSDDKASERRRNGAG